MGDTMTVAEYTHATTELRWAASEHVASELAATKEALRRLRTAEGKIEQKRRANINAARLVHTARMAERKAEAARVARESLESEAVGRQRLIEATAECYGMTVTEVLEGEARRIRP